MRPSAIFPDSDGILCAKTRQGCDLPIIDLTQPRFAVPDDPANAHALYQAFIDSERRRRRFPRFLMRLLLRSAARKSLLVKALFQSSTGFLDGVSTYVMKLGVENLVPPYDRPIDRKFAASPHIALLRLRMQQTARFLAEGLMEDLLPTNGAPLDLINIGGGPAVDSINALLMLHRERPDLMERPITIHVLDADEDGPFFGANALAALKAVGAPLHGLHIEMTWAAYNWNVPAALERLVRELQAKGGVIAASSEGGLFEYGDDDAIIANLNALRANGAGAGLVAGSVTRADENRRRMIAETRFKLYPRGLEGFAPLAARGGFAIVKTESAMLSDQVLLRPAA